MASVRGSAVTGVFCVVALTPLLVSYGSGGKGAVDGLPFVVVKLLDLMTYGASGASIPRSFRYFGRPRVCVGCGRPVGKCAVGMV